ncbi:ERCC4 domain-containing protein [Phthorimaea operculella]|nr:ERCC4 domain-containing protein [Phthorimaea operculella]
MDSVSHIEGKRITLKRHRPNPLFEEWLEELHEEAKAKKSKLESMLKEALDSLSKYPLPLESGMECAVLKGFDKKLCMFLDKRIEAYNYNLQLDCSYAILIALLEQLRDNPQNPGLKKEVLIEKAQPHSEESFTRPKPDSFYTAWSNMSRLVSKGLVTQVRSKKTDYFLTDEGVALAIELLEDAQNRPTVNDIIFNGAPSTSTTVSMKTSESNSSSTQSSQLSALTLSQRTLSGLTSVELPAGTFDIILLIDKQETSGNRKNDPTVAQFNKYPDLKHEYRSLKVGDYTWIARHKTHTDQELVLPYIVERKRMDDLGHSIKDGRFHEQKFRLRKCGLKNVIYLVENFGSNKHVGLPMQSLMQALANTRVQDGFKVHVTDSLTNTTRFLAMMTKRLTIEYKDQHLIGKNAEPQDGELMIFSYFNKSSIKNKPLTVTETFIKLMLQLKGVSVEKALAIAKVYTTPKALLKEYEKCSQKQGETLLANLKYGNLNKNVGPMVSKAIYKFFVWEVQD